MSLLTTPTQNLLVIDSHVTNWQSLANGVAPNTAVLILDSGSDGLTQISNYLATLTNAGTQNFVPLQSLQIISHGSAGSLLLGSSTISTGNLNLYSKQLASIGSNLTDTGDILLYGCDVAADKPGLDFINQIAELTSTDVAASNDVTGSATLGGNWQLEIATGTIESALALNTATLNSNTSILSIAYDQGGLNEAFLSAYDSISGKTFTFDTGVSYNTLVANVNNAAFSLDFDLSGLANWTSFITGATTSTIKYVVAVGNANGYAAAMTGAPLVTSSALFFGMDTAAAISLHVIDINSKVAVNNAQNLSTLVLDTEAASSGQHYNAASAWAGWIQDPQVAFGTAAAFQLGVMDQETGDNIASTFAGTWNLTSTNLTFGAQTPVNNPPTFTAFAASVATGNEDSQIAVTFGNLQAQSNDADIDGTVTAFVIKAVSSGSLKIGTSADSATAWNASSNATVDATHKAFWTPAANANGTLKAFTAVAKDNGGLVSATAIQAKVSVTPVNDAPILIKPTAISYTDTVFDDTFAAATGSLKASDIDSKILTYGITGGIDNGKGAFTLASTYGVLTVIKATGTYSFVANDAAIETLKVKASIDFTVTASDGLLNNSKTLTITITQQGTTESTGNDTLTGTTGNDKFNGLAGNDTISGLAGNDILNGGLGADTLVGGSGNDSYFIDNIGDKVIEKAGEGTDTVNSSITYTLETNVENLTLTGAATLNGTGNALNNTLTGNAAANILNGLAGNDTIVGLAGNDFLSGGLGTDKLTGGTGSDIFDFNTSTESAKGLARDTITDFTHSQGDKIDLAGIDANIKVLGNQGFTYIGAKAFTGVAGQLDYFNGILAGDTNGDKVADFEIALIGSPSLVSADFVL